MPLTLDEIRRHADGTYPSEVLADCDTALLLFAAGFHGRQDGIFVADAGIEATCVDIRPKRLHEMAEVYPAAWEFFVADAFDYAFEAREARRSWNLVSIDSPSGAFQKCAELVGLWTLLADRVVVLGTGAGTVVRPSEGWRVAQVVRRSDFAGGTFWTVLERTT